jgi:hypothetical protein
VALPAGDMPTFLPFRSARLRSGDPSRVTKVASATWVASTRSIGAPWMPSVKAPGAGGSECHVDRLRQDRFGRRVDVAEAEIFRLQTLAFEELA